MSDKIIEKEFIATDDDLYNDLIEEDDQGFECQTCNFSSDKIEILLRHIEDSHPVSGSAVVEDLHQYDEHGENTVVKFMCSLCFLPFATIDDVKKHMIDDHNLKEKPKPAPVSPTPTATVTPPDHSEFLNLSLADLKAKLLKQSIYRCAIKGCMYKFETPERRDIHLKCHSSFSNAREFKCCDCNEEQKGWRQCCMHLWKVHHIDVDLLKCPICPFKAKNTMKIFQHLQVHRGHKGFPCISCTKVFPNYCQLRRHSLSHLDMQKQDTVTRWYSQKTCQICLNVFANSKTLTKHMKRHNKIVSYRCNICGKGSRNKATWLIHMRQHTGEKPLKCKVCPFNARDPSVMRKHTLRHLAQKPYKCKICDYSAIQTVGLKLHIRINHPEEYEKMKCTLCNFIYISPEVLERHYNDHKAGLVKTDEEAKEAQNGPTATLQQARQMDNRIKPSEVSSDCFLPLESTDPHDPPLDIGGVTIPAHSEDTQFTIFN